MRFECQPGKRLAFFKFSIWFWLWFWLTLIFFFMMLGTKYLLSILKDKSSLIPSLDMDYFTFAVIMTKYPIRIFLKTDGSLIIDGVFLMTIITMLGEECCFTFLMCVTVKILEWSFCIMDVVFLIKEHLHSFINWAQSNFL